MVMSPHALTPAREHWSTEFGNYCGKCQSGGGHTAQGARHGGPVRDRTDKPAKPLNVSAMRDLWYENLRCPTCGKTGKARLSQDDDDAPTAQIVPDGFKVVDTEHGPDFRCLTCNVAVEP